MAKKSSVVKNEKRRKLAEKLEPIRRALRKKVIDSKLPAKERTAAALKLQKLPKNGSLCRVVNRCRITGPSRRRIPPRPPAGAAPCRRVMQARDP